MTRTASARVSCLYGITTADPVRRPRRTLVCRWERCPSTGTLAGRWEVAAVDLASVPGAARERGQPPSPLPLAA